MGTSTDASGEGAMSRASAIFAASAGADLSEHNIGQLIERHGHAVEMADLPWLGGIYGKLRQGYPLSNEQRARVSAIRGKLARQSING
jgi:hypothetical protein